jgi:diadenosine tetraphosphate (Ap4A) HIT family hydrolase
LSIVREKAIKSFANWKIIKNPFPYDRIATTHHMIVPRRHVQERKLSKKEISDFERIKDTYLHKTYEFIIESTYRKKSIPDHLHLHLILAK